jgi:hypothetical protein
VAYSSDLPKFNDPAALLAVPAAISAIMCFTGTDANRMPSICTLAGRPASIGFLNGKSHGLQTPRKQLAFWGGKGGSCWNPVDAGFPL